jgi:hypothetical protein
LRYQPAVVLLGFEQPPLVALPLGTAHVRVTDPLLLVIVNVSLVGWDVVTTVKLVAVPLALER